MTFETLPRREGCEDSAWRFEQVIWSSTEAALAKTLETALIMEIFDDF
jgi:hypothetical protein